MESALPALFRVSAGRAWKFNEKDLKERRLSSFPCTVLKEWNRRILSHVFPKSGGKNDGNPSKKCIGCAESELYNTVRIKGDD